MTRRWPSCLLPLAASWLAVAAPPATKPAAPEADFTAAEATEMMRAVCDGDVDLRAEDQRRSAIYLGCRKCPAFTRGLGGRFLFNAAVVGNFSAPDVDEALVDLSGCESPKDANGGTALVRRGTDGAWHRAGYARGVRTGECYTTATKDRRSAAVCVSERLDGDAIVRRFEFVHATAHGLAGDRIFEYEARPSDAGCEKQRSLFDTHETLDLRDVNGDGLADLVIDLEVSTVGVEHSGTGCRPNEKTRSVDHFELVFLNDHDSFFPAAATPGEVRRLRDVRR